MRPGLFAFAIASVFLGAALYINLVEQPARLALDARSMVREWVPSNRRGFVLLSSLAIISAILAYGDFAHTGDVRWIIGGTVILLSWLYAYFVIVPVNIWFARVGSRGMGRNGDRVRSVLHTRLGSGLPCVI
jgi:hypothetical protein